MRRFENVDILDTLAAVMERNTKHYQTDFEYDRASIIKAAESPDARENPLLWMSRTNGTWMLDEREVFISGSEAHHTWEYYTHDSVCAFAIEIKGMELGKPVGTLYELDYLSHVEHVKRVSLSMDGVSLTFEDGSTKRFNNEQYKGNWIRLQNQYGRIHGCRYEVKDEAVLQSILKQEHTAWQRYPSRSFGAFIKGLDAPDRLSITDRLNETKKAVKPPSSDKTAARRPEL